MSKKVIETPEAKKERELVETIAQEICKLSRQVTALLTGRLNRDAVIILLAHSTGLPQRTIMHVLSAIEGMEKKYTK